MIICKLEVKRFRAVKTADLVLDEPLIALIGRGDAAKTTLLDAIAWALWPNWYLGPSDADFSDCDVSEPIEIEVTVRPVPETLLSEQAFGLYVRGWDPETKDLRDEPRDGDVSALTVRVSVDGSLEPEWEVVADRHGEGRRINSNQRRLLGANRLGEDIDRHLAWGRSSALLTMTADTAETEILLAELNRGVRKAVGEADLTDLATAIDSARTSSVELGAGQATQDMYPALDPSEIVGRPAAIALHSGPAVPLRRFGIGTRRLVALSVQAASIDDGAVLLIDEIERGLEPFRIRHILKVLRAAVGQPDVDLETTTTAGQVMLTTHSPVVVAELPCEHLRIARLSSDGELSLLPVSPDLQGLVRRHSEVLLGRAALVAEGKTEEGLLRAMADAWTSTHGGEPIANRGVVIVNGDGRTKAPPAAISLKRLEYDVCVLGDSDAPLEPSADVLETHGIDVQLWSENLSTEQRLAADLPLDALKALVEAIAHDRGVTVVAGETLVELGLSRDDHGDTMDSWLESGVPETEVRRGLGQAMKRCGWIKRVDWGGMGGAPRRAELGSARPGV